MVKFRWRNLPVSYTSFQIQSYQAAFKIVNNLKSILEMTELFYLPDRKKMLKFENFHPLFFGFTYIY